MLYPAQLYAEELKRKLISCWYNPKYQWYFGGEQFAHQVSDNAEYRHEFVHLDSNGNIDGYFSYHHDDAARSLNNFGLVSFSEMNLAFIKDVIDRIKYMLFEEGFSRLDFWCFADNPVRKAYEKMIKLFGGHLAGTLHRTAYFGNNYHDTCFYEILKENISDKIKEKYL
jgi:RimJ/RimL family protein N-acetyltransferase